MNKIVIYALLVGALAIGACSPVKMVSERKLKRPSQSTYETFSFGLLEKRVKVNHANSKKTEIYLQEEIKRELEDRGYIYVDENPDFVLDMELLLRNVKQRNDSGPYPMGGFGFRRRFYSPVDRFGYYDDIQNGSFTEAKINLLVAGVEEKAKLYEGSVRARLSPNPRKGTQRLQAAIDRLLISFLGE